MRPLSLLWQNWPSDVGICCIIRVKTQVVLLFHLDQVMLIYAGQNLAPDADLVAVAIRFVHEAVRVLHVDAGAFARDTDWLCPFVVNMALDLPVGVDGIVRVVQAISKGSATLLPVAVRVTAREQLVPGATGRLVVIVISAHLLIVSFDNKSNN